MLKKEIPLGNAKIPFYNNFEIQQRRDISSDQFSMPSNIGNVQATPPPVSNNSAIHNSNYGPAQLLMKQNQSNAKGRFPNANAADAFYGSGYFGKQSNPAVDYYGKYEVEFAAHQQKSGLPNQAAPFNQPSKADFADTKPPADFHHIKGEIHHGVKPEFVQQQHHKNLEFHHGKAPNFHLNHQNFYNHHGPHGTNVDGAHQVPVQYNANQYFPNEYGGANDLDAPAAAYYEQKAASAQQSYYENMYNTSGNSSAAEFHTVNNAAYGTPPAGQLPNEHCDGFMYPQYFEGTHSDSNVPNQSSQAPAHNHHAQGHSATHQNQHYNHGVGGPHYHVAQQHINGNQHISGSPMDNSNSSSDFNFLSNIANDFAPEYYQLS